MGGARRQGEPGRAGRLGHPGESPKVPRILQPFQVEVGAALAHRQCFDAPAGEGGDREDAARRVGVRQLFQEIGFDFEQLDRQAARQALPLGGGEKARRREHRFQLQTGGERLGDQVRSFEQRRVAFTSPEPANILQPSILATDNHDPRS
jgi:hypothetical protein